VEQVRAYREKLPPLKIGKHGQITVDKTPGLAEAAKKTLERRLKFGGGHTGWSCAWIINLYAQLRMGEEALGMLKHLFEQSTFDNLMDNHPYAGGAVFQIDGNLGGCDAILQMLVQDDGERVLLLPACPKEWREGSLRGVRLKGNAALDLEWSAGRVHAVISAESPWKGRVVCRGREAAFSLEKGSTGSFDVN